MQLGRLGVQHGLSPTMRQSFVHNSKPFLANGKSLVGAEAGAILINEDGVMNTYYLPGATTIDGGRTVKYTPDYRFYLMRSPTTDYSNKDNFYMPLFPGKTFSVDIDFKRDGPSCGCNLNFYLVSMPWPTAGKDNDYYCDAQCFPGMGCCAEFDMNEGNMSCNRSRTMRARVTMVATQIGSATSGVTQRSRLMRAISALAGAILLTAANLSRTPSVSR